MFVWMFLFFTIQSFCQSLVMQHFEQVGYTEICNRNHDAVLYDHLYACFDEFITFLQTNKLWARKLEVAKQRFIRSEYRRYYSTDFFGFYDESQRIGNSQISFYYSTHFHEFICLHYPEFQNIPEIINFFDKCRDIQKPFPDLFLEMATELGLQTLFAASYNQPPVLLKVVKYLSSYCVTRPHYDGTAFTIFLHSTDNQSLFLSPYKSAYTIDDFFSPVRVFENSLLLIPGALLGEFFIYPTPHSVVPQGKIRYATIAFAMRPLYVSQKNEFSYLPSFKY